jgi:hypothetical protein
MSVAEAGRRINALAADSRRSISHPACLCSSLRLQSKAQSFQGHLATLMSSWAVVCDVYYLEPQRIQAGENGIAFSNRVKKLIAEKAGLKNVSYDGYLKHFEVKQSLIEKQQKMYADVLLKRLTPEEKAEIAREEQRIEQAKSTSPTTQPFTISAVASGPDSLALSPSPDDVAPSLRAAATKSLTRSTSDPNSLSPNSPSQKGLANIGSAADLLALLNQTQEEERKAAAGGSTLKQRK